MTGGSSRIGMQIRTAASKEKDSHNEGVLTPSDWADVDVADDDEDIIFMGDNNIMMCQETEDKGENSQGKGRTKASNTIRPKQSSKKIGAVTAKSAKNNGIKRRKGLFSRNDQSWRKQSSRSRRRKHGSRTNTREIISQQRNKKARRGILSPRQVQPRHENKASFSRRNCSSPTKNVRGSPRRSRHSSLTKAHKSSPQEKEQSSPQEKDQSGPQEKDQPSPQKDRIRARTRRGRRKHRRSPRKKRHRSRLPSKKRRHMPWRNRGLFGKAKQSARGRKIDPNNIFAPPMSSIVLPPPFKFEDETLITDSTYVEVQLEEKSTITKVNGDNSWHFRFAKALGNIQPLAIIRGILLSKAAAHSDYSIESRRTDEDYSDRKTAEDAQILSVPQQIVDKSAMCSPVICTSLGAELVNEGVEIDYTGACLACGMIEPTKALTYAKNGVNSGAVECGDKAVKTSTGFIKACQSPSYDDSLITGQLADDMRSIDETEETAFDDRTKETAFDDGTNSITDTITVSEAMCRLIPM